MHTQVFIVRLNMFETRLYVDATESVTCLFQSVVNRLIVKVLPRYRLQMTIVVIVEHDLTNPLYPSLCTFAKAMQTV